MDRDDRVAELCAPVRTYRQTCWAAPSQWEGELHDRRMFYVRVRHGRLEVRVSPRETIDVMDAVRAPAALLVALEDPAESFMDEKTMQEATASVLNFGGATRVDADPIG